jgi:hypothetical protein
MQIVVHLCLVGASIVLLVARSFEWPSPITPEKAWKPVSTVHSEMHTIVILLVAVGLQFSVLSTTAPLLQNWIERADAQINSYRLYAISNLASFVALISYPLLIEPYFRLHTQAWTWTAGYLVFSSGVSYCAATGAGGPKLLSASKIAPVGGSKVSLYLHWLGLAACASTALFAITNVMCQDVASFALLWVVPLSLYLFSFVICFGTSRLYKRIIFHPLLAVATILAFIARCTYSIAFQLVAYSLVLFAICVTCHGELERLKPGPAGLTYFYTAVATGGALGGIFVVLVAPLAFPDFWEFDLALWGVSALMVFTVHRDRNSWWYSLKSWWGIGLFIFAFVSPMIASHFAPSVGGVMNDLNYYHALELLTLVVLLCIFITRRKFKRIPLRGIQISVVAMLVLCGWMSMAFIQRRAADHVIARIRNFYGVFMVQQDQSLTLLIHGGTYQGAQFRGVNSRLRPTTYYGHNSGIGILLENHPKRISNESMRIGVVGLGVGTLAAYGRPGDYLRFYEIDPDILRLSEGPHPLFTYLEDSLARYDVVIGDARLSLESEAIHNRLQNLDVLVIDAFNGDAIPVHLLTKEAAQAYLQHLSPDGVLAFHVTNASLDLVPVTLGLGREFGLSVLLTKGYDSDFNVYNEWVLLSRDRGILKMPQLLQSGRLLDFEPSCELWTDDYSDVWRLMVARFGEREK